jgi:CRP-like cAMP-binding protein
VRQFVENAPAHGIGDFEPAMLFSAPAPPECLRELVTFSTEEYPAGVQLFRQGSMPDTVYFISDGLLKLARVDCEGNEVIVCVRGVGWLLGATTVILEQSHATTAHTLTACTFHRIAARVFRAYLMTKPSFSLYVHQMQSHEIRESVVRLSALMLHSARQRLIDLLLQVSRSMKSASSKSSGACPLNIPLKQWELAQLLSISPEHINRLLRGLEQEGLVHRRKRSLVICDSHKMLDYACQQGYDSPRGSSRPVV